MTKEELQVREHIRWGGKNINETCEPCSEPYEVDEGSNGGSYWAETEANAIRLLYQLIALSRMRSGGVWSEKS